MKKCFTFNSYSDCKMVENFLKEVIPSPVHIQLGNSIAVADEVYEKAILEGKKFTAENRFLEF